MKASVLLTAALGIVAASAATIPAAAQAQAQLAAGRAVPPAADGVERRKVDWLSVAPQIVESVAPYIPHVVDKVGNGLKRLGRFITGKGKKKKSGKRDGLGGLAEGGTGGAAEEADGEAERVVARRLVA
ncbi:hypothetical protein RB595_004319 [Gaeumannomyces hyphopodioides]